MALRVKTEGGSQGMVRVWVLLKIKGQLKIIEAKELSPTPAVAHYSQQEGTRPRFKSLLNLFWNEQPNDFGLLKAADRYFWLRPRRKNFFKTHFPHASNPEQVTHFREQMNYIANHLGRRHGEQDTGRTYLKAIEADPELFRLLLKKQVQSYFELSTQNFRNSTRSNE